MEATSTRSNATRNIIFRLNYEPDVGDPSMQKADLQQPEQPILLHQLCKYCRIFAQECDLVNILDSPKPSSQTISRREFALLRNCLETWPHDSPQYVPLELHPATKINLCPVGRQGGITFDKDEPHTISFYVDIKCGPLEVAMDRALNIRFDTVPWAIRWPDIPTDGRDNIREIKGWLQFCLSEHAQCHVFQKITAGTPKWPKRLLDLSQNRVRLQCSLESTDTPEYLTLSHLWGRNPGRQVRLLNENVDRFQHEIPTDYFSIPYREAIRITRALGYRYLWIDSLCIIQDSISDWEEEAGKMAEVYGNSICNIAYLFPPEDQIPRACADRREWAACLLRSDSSTGQQVYVRRKRGLRAERWADPRHWPLFSRAWAFQEQLLSARTVYLGDQSLVWECSQLCCDEVSGPMNVNLKSDLIHLGSTTSPDGYVFMPPEFFSGMESSTRSHLCAWLNIVNLYRQRNLSRESNRVMAFAGIARAVYNIHSITYLAGLWKEILLPSLLWWVPEQWNSPAATQSLCSKDPDKSDAPSLQLVWSWFSVPASYSRDLSLNFYDRSYWGSGREGPNVVVSRQNSKGIWGKLVSFGWMSHHEDQVPGNSFYDFANLHVKLDCWTLSARLVNDEKAKGRLNLQFDRPPECNDPRFQGWMWSKTIYHHDAFRFRNKEENDCPLELKAALIGTFKVLKRGCSAKFLEEENRWEYGVVDNHFFILGGLVVARQQGHSAWKRIGSWECEFNAWWDSTMNWETFKGILTTESTYDETDARSLFDCWPAWESQQITLI